MLYAVRGLHWQEAAMFYMSIWCSLEIVEV